MNQILSGASVYTPNGFIRADVVIGNGRIVSVGSGVSVSGAQVVSLNNMFIVPGLADVHVHLREPGFSYKETIRTGTEAAARGGYTAVCSMPNLSPPPDCEQSLRTQLRMIADSALVAVNPYGCITMGQRGGGELVDMKLLHDMGAIAFSDDGKGIQRQEDMRRAMELAAQHDLLIAAHCEDESLLHGGYIHDGEYAKAHGHRGISSQSEWGQIERDLHLAEQTGCRYHVCHISTGESVELIRRAKDKGVRVTCETAPHYLLLCDEQLQEDGRFKMNPPLRSRHDRDALVAGITDGTIDMIATDHAPHAAEEKVKGLEKSAMGVVGLETAFATLYTGLVQRGVITLERLIELMAVNPRRVFGLGEATIGVGAPASLAVLDLDTQYTIDPEQFASMGRATPFAGARVQGRIAMTIYNGRIIYGKGI